jgi:hypothetical protein
LHADDRGRSDHAEQQQVKRRHRQRLGVRRESIEGNRAQIGELSGGQQQLVFLARALVGSCQTWGSPSASSSPLPCRSSRFDCSASLMAGVPARTLASSGSSHISRPTPLANTTSAGAKLRASTATSAADRAFDRVGRAVGDVPRERGQRHISRAHPGGRHLRASRHAQKKRYLVSILTAWPHVT